MKTHVEFRSAKFQALPGEEDAINPGRWGKQLADYLVKELHERGIETGVIGEEDWGYHLPIKHDPFPLWIGCGNYEEYPDGFLCMIEPSQPVIRKWIFKKIDTTAEVERVAKVLNDILQADPDIRDVRWLDAATAL